MERKRANDKAQDSHSGDARFELGLGHRVSEGFAWFSLVLLGNIGNMPQRIQSASYIKLSTEA